MDRKRTRERKDQGSYSVVETQSSQHQLAKIGYACTMQVIIEFGCVVKGGPNVLAHALSLGGVLAQTQNRARADSSLDDKGVPTLDIGARYGEAWDLLRKAFTGSAKSEQWISPNFVHAPSPGEVWHRPTGKQPS
eukprot:Nk52_evm16s219 gene=Nk52_evmTU16s219